MINHIFSDGEVAHEYEVGDMVNIVRSINDYSLAIDSSREYWGKVIVVKHTCMGYDGEPIPQNWMVRSNVIKILGAKDPEDIRPPLFFGAIKDIRHHIVFTGIFPWHIDPRPETIINETIQETLDIPVG